MPQTVHRYPLKVFTEETDYLQIDMQEYVPIGGGSPTDDSNIKFNSSFNPTSLTTDPESRFRRNSTKRPISTVLLPIPSTIQDGNAVKYTDDELSSITAAGAAGAANIMRGAADAKFDMDKQIKNFKESMTTALDQSGLDLGNTQNLITNYLAGQAVGIFGGNISLQQILARQQGEIFNPNMELLFGGPTLRAFKFSFKMMPRNRDESDQVKSIIRTFKKGMSPKTGQTRAFIKTPNIFELRYRQGRTEHRFLNKFKQCFLQDISVNYTGEGNYATYGDGTPISMIMDLTFKELEPIYDIDNDDPISGLPRESTVGY